MKEYVPEFDVKVSNIPPKAPENDVKVSSICEQVTDILTYVTENLCPISAKVPENDVKVSENHIDHHF